MTKDNYPRCVYMALPAEIMAVRPNCYEVYWYGHSVAEFSTQLSAERYLEMEFSHIL